MKLRTGPALALPAALALVTAGSPALATETRIDSMGGGVKLWTIEDESNIFDFPSLLVRWGNRVYVDAIEATTDDIPGGHFDFLHPWPGQNPPLTQRDARMITRWPRAWQLAQPLPSAASSCHRTSAGNLDA